MAQGVSAFPVAVTAQMVKNFVAGGAAVNQLCQAADSDLRVYELALEGGRPVMGVRLEDPERRRAAVETIRRHGGHFINRFGAWATEEIAPWRGEMPRLPQYLQR